MEVQSCRDRPKIRERSDQQNCRDDEGERQRELQHHQSLSKPGGTDAAGRGPAAFAKRSGKHCPHGAEHGREARKRRRADTGTDREDQNAPVESDIERHRPAELREQRNSETREPDSGDKSEDGSRRAKHQRLDEQQPSDARAARAEGGAHGDLPAAIGRSSQQQIGDVRARDEQDQQRGAEQQSQRRSRRRRQRRVALFAWLQEELAFLLSLDHGRERRLNLVQIGGCGFERRVRLQAAHHGQPARAAARQQVHAAKRIENRLLTDSSPEPAIAADRHAVKARVNDADDGELPIVHEQRSGLEASRIAEQAAPQPFVHDEDRRGARTIVVFDNAAARDQARSDGGEEAARHELAVDHLGHATRRAHGQFRAAVGDEIDEGALPCPIVREVGIREVVIDVVGSAAVQHERQRARILDRERRQHRRVEQAEDHRRHRDADDERQHGDDGDDGAAANRPPADAHVLPE